MGGDGPSSAAADEGPEFMALDGAALENLEVRLCVGPPGFSCQEG